MHCVFQSEDTERMGILRICRCILREKQENCFEVDKVLKICDFYLRCHVFSNSTNANIPLRPQMLQNDGPDCGMIAVRKATEEEIKDYRQYRLLFDREEDEDSHGRKFFEGC